jgi:hypothetical protein
VNGGEWCRSSYEGRLDSWGNYEPGGEMRGGTREELEMMAEPYDDLRAMGLDIQMATPGLLEEELASALTGLWSGWPKPFVSLEVQDSPIRRVSVLRIPGNGVGVDAYGCAYIVPDPKVPVRQHLKAKCTYPKSVPLVGRVVDVRWKGNTEDHSIGRLNQDQSLKRTLIELRESVRVISFPEQKCWAISPGFQPADKLRTSREQWDCYQTIARHLLEGGAKRERSAEDELYLQQRSKELRELEERRRRGGYYGR